MALFPRPRRRHPFYMVEMIRGQPEFVRETLRRVADGRAASVLRKTRHLILTGCGTSFHAAWYGARILQRAVGSRAVVEAVSAYDLAYGQPQSGGATVVGVSHSGSTPTTNRALARARTEGHITLGVCGVSGSPMEDIVDEVFVIGSVHDRSWANTMSYTTQLAGFAGIAARVAGTGLSAVSAMVPRIPAALSRAIACEDSVRRLAIRVAAKPRVTFLASGWDDITVLEAALKIRETCGLPASGYPLEQFLHGPFLSIDSSEAIVVLRGAEDGRRAQTILHALRKTGASLEVIGEHPGMAIRLPRIHPWLRPILSVVPMQFLAYYAALARRTNPDIMRTGIPRLRAGVEALFH
jgi:glucosamine--fructose-6-phosphate aminotransferase (isomerizing)